MLQYVVLMLVTPSAVPVLVLELILVSLLTLVLLLVLLLMLVLVLLLMLVVLDVIDVESPTALPAKQSSRTAVIGNLMVTSATAARAALKRKGPEPLSLLQGRFHSSTTPLCR